MVPHGWRWLTSESIEHAHGEGFVGRDEAGRQRKRNFAKRDGVDPDKHASAFAARIKAALDDGTYVDPADANTAFQTFAEDRRKSRDHETVRAARIESLLRRHTAASAWLSAGADIVAVAAWLGDTVETVYKTYAHLMPDSDDRGRKAIDQFFRRPGREGSALDVPSDGAK